MKNTDKIILEASKQVGEYNQRLMKLLVRYNPFRDEIKKVRKKFYIPENGFQKIGQFLDNLYNKSDKIQESKQYKARLLALRSDFRKRKIPPQEYTNKLDELNSLLPSKQWEKTLQSILHKYKLTDNFLETIRYFTLTDKIEFVPSTNFGVKPPFPKHGANKLEVTVYRRLTKKELASLNEQIRLFETRFPKYLKDRKKIGNFEKDFQLFDELTKSKNGSIKSKYNEVVYKIWDEEQEQDLSNLGKLDKKNKNKAKQKISRIKRKQRQLFGD